MMEALLDGITRLASTTISLSACVWLVGVRLALPIVLKHGKSTARPAVAFASDPDVAANRLRRQPAPPIIESKVRLARAPERWVWPALPASGPMPIKSSSRSQSSVSL